MISTLVQDVPVARQNAGAAQEIAERYGAQVAVCYQCKRCTAGCPVADVMELRPHQVVRLARYGAIDRLLASDAIWDCVGCYLCTTRCPQAVPVAELFYSLKGQAMKRDATSPRTTVPALLKAFAAPVKRSGRSCEFEMSARYYMFSVQPTKALKEIPTALKLVRQGRLPLLGERVRGWKKVRAMLRKAVRLGGRS